MPLLGCGDTCTGSWIVYLNCACMLGVRSYVCVGARLRFVQHYGKDYMM